MRLVLYILSYLTFFIAHSAMRARYGFWLVVSEKGIVKLLNPREAGYPNID